MCLHSDNIDYLGGDKHLCHGPVAQALANYISHTPGLHCRPFRYPAPESPEPDPLDTYIDNAIHRCQVPDIVAYAACYLLISISQPCQCRIPHDGDTSQCTLSSPSKLSHIRSRATTRTPFANFRWSDRHVFVGAFYFALVIYRGILNDEQGKELACWNKLPLLLGISEMDIMNVAIMFKPYVTSELQVAMKWMIENDVERDIVEIDCPFVLARRNRLVKAEQKRQERKSSLKGSIGSVLKLRREPMHVL